MAEPSPFDLRTRSVAASLRAGDKPPETAEQWGERRKVVLAKMRESCGPVPEKPCDLTPKIHGELKRDGYRIEKITFQTRPDVWVTATAYVPEVAAKEKVPAVLVVHGHWAWARRDPVVQSRSLGLAKLGFFVLAVDAFGAGERHPKPARGTYHGGLMGSTLWPTGHTLLGMQVYDNQRAVDYLLSRPEVNGKLGITGASGGGNQSMNGGALDERFQAVVPVCSVGSYQAYLKAACCVCEVLPNALTYTDEGDVLGLVAPRALMVINASKDGIQFSPAEAERSVSRAKKIYETLKIPEKFKHVVIESGHDYNQPMRELMYGWMTWHLKGIGKGDAIPEPKFNLDTPEDLTIFPNPDDRPKVFLTPTLFAAKVAKEQIKASDDLKPDHPEMWQARALAIRKMVTGVLGLTPILPDARIKTMGEKTEGNFQVITGDLVTEAGITIPTAQLDPKDKEAGRVNLVLHLEGSVDALKLSVIETLKQKKETILTADLRVTGAAKSTWGGVAGAPDHTVAEHGIWIGQPLLGQWVHDAMTLLMIARKTAGNKPVRIIAYGQAGVVAAIAAGLMPEAGADLVLLDVPPTFASDTPYGSGTMMGLLAPGILRAGDIPHFLALNAPKKITVTGSVSLQGNRLNQKEAEAAFAFPAIVSKTLPGGKFTVSTEPFNPQMLGD
ncbi:dienelactone hydrolase family protein [Zavarzinella formosa]|uniref:dienelactone hydrolase family protein n=1 Tax=Zavarzinella formosa TaxID=360055 RepID=UPI0002DCD3EC|nr:acetylxylan esterase [Zavarzinella formosa]